MGLEQPGAMQWNSRRVEFVTTSYEIVLHVYVKSATHFPSYIRTFPPKCSIEFIYKPLIPLFTVVEIMYANYFTDMICAANIYFIDFLYNKLYVYYNIDIGTRKYVIPYRETLL